MTIPFLKMHGAANDFVVIDHRRRFLAEPLEPLVVRLCDRRRGVGADGVLLLESDPEHDFAMRYFNADGRPADYCGNGARCLARLALDLGLGRAGRVRFRTEAGVQDARRHPEGNGIELHFGRVASEGERCDVEAETLACGSGAIASALWAALQGERSPVSVVTGGGDELVVSFRRLEDGFDVTLGGPAEVAFQGEWVERAAEPVGL